MSAAWTKPFGRIVGGAKNVGVGLLRCGQTILDFAQTPAGWSSHPRRGSGEPQGVAWPSGDFAGNVLWKPTACGAVWRGHPLWKALLAETIGRSCKVPTTPGWGCADIARSSSTGASSRDPGDHQPRLPGVSQAAASRSGRFARRNGAAEPSRRTVAPTARAWMTAVQDGSPRLRPPRTLPEFSCLSREPE